MYRETLKKKHFCIVKGNNQQNVQATCRMGENNFESYIWYEVNIHSVQKSYNSKIITKKKKKRKERKNQYKWAKCLARQFTNEDMQVANKNIKRCFLSLTTENWNGKSNLEWVTTLHSL